MAEEAPTPCPAQRRNQCFRQGLMRGHLTPDAVPAQTDPRKCGNSPYPALSGHGPIHRAMSALPSRTLLSVGAARSVTTPGRLPWALPTTSRRQPLTVLVSPPAASALPALPKPPTSSRVF
ncbi:hypothetical protein MC885_001284 [Smutsia gigantea]|nr:hypothetical protein MC885_001284 [Smutsia gigantea]